ncbi:TIGR02117 family protein [Neisseria sp. Ec49-e6-T10]|uniref:TIGR02117 family protein n=1 Tax=Neisseria sp. Ec49-e6-T10 TaxID=3140744 RepID=UPI003EBFF477
MIKRTIYFIGKIFFGLIGLGVGYFLLAFLLGLTSVNNDFNPTQGTIKIFLISNGTHAGIAVPTAHPQKDWRTIFLPTQTKNPTLSQNKPYILIGWGSKTFYTKVPNWGDLRPSTAIKAITFDDSVLHGDYINEPESLHYAKAIMLTSTQYTKLIESIESELSYDGQKQTQYVNVHYHNTDVFYNAKQSYTAWRTCNQWVRNQLSIAGVSVPAWAPFAQTLFWHLP